MVVFRIFENYSENSNRWCVFCFFVCQNMLLFHKKEKGHMSLPVAEHVCIWLNIHWCHHRVKLHFLSDCNSRCHVFRLIPVMRRMTESDSRDKIGTWRMWSGARMCVPLIQMIEISKHCSTFSFITDLPAWAVKTWENCKLNVNNCPVSMWCCFRLGGLLYHNSSRSSDLAVCMCGLSPMSMLTPVCELAFL